MKKVAILLIILLFIFATRVAIVQEKCVNIVNTKWIYKWNEKVEDYNIFGSDCSYEEYRVEMDNYYFGSYYVFKDTIFVAIDSAKYMHHFSKIRKKLLLKNDTLHMVYSKYGHLEPKTRFDEKYYFIRDYTFMREKISE